MVRSLQWASGRLVELDAADEMIAVPARSAEHQRRSAISRLVLFKVPLFLTICMNKKTNVRPT